MKEAKKVKITETICKQAQLMRKGGANQTEIGKLLGVNPCTISRIEKAGFDLEKYQESRRMEKQKEKEKAEKTATVKAITNEEMAKNTVYMVEQVPGQMEMELTPEKPEMSDQTKLMRFQAAQTDRILRKQDAAIMRMDIDAALVKGTLEKIYDMMGQLIRAVRKE